MHPNCRPQPSPADLDLVEHVARTVSRASGLSREDTDDFVQTVHVRMAERNYHVLTSFEGRSSLRTYLTVVIARLLKDWRNHEYGRWRPCAAARDLGFLGVELDRLVNRDGHTAEEAVQLLSSATATPEPVVRDVAKRLPRRARRLTVSVEAAEGRPVQFVDPLSDRLRRQDQNAALTALRLAVVGLPREDIRLLRTKIDRTATIADLARAGKGPAPELYRKRDRILRRLRDHLRSVGITAAAVPG
jgi:DNA-directed RNA polymerase specialized sigma24 family protein